MQQNIFSVETTIGGEGILAKIQNPNAQGKPNYNTLLVTADSIEQAIDKAKSYLTENNMQVEILTVKKELHTFLIL